MRIIINSTSKIVGVDGVPARVWEGHTDKGVPVTALVTLLAVDRAEDLAEFEADLAEQPPPSAEVAAWPARLLLN